jgi:hypothetical protein
MNFSIYQWLFTIVLDFFLKAGLVGLLFNFNFAFGALIASVWSMFHFFWLSFACVTVGSLNLTQTAKFWLALTVSAILFAGCAIALWILSIKGGHETGCAGIEMRCDWINGEITSNGVQAIAVSVLILVAVNWISILISAALGNLANRIFQSLRSQADVKR